MATETGTFSALVEDVRKRSGRMDRTADIVSYARSTMRECTVLGEFSQNTIEGTVTATAVPFVLKRPSGFRMWEAIRSPYFSRRNKSIYFIEKKPGNEQNTNNPYWFYRAGDSFVFNGLAVNDILTYAYQQYLPKLHFYATAADRPATYDLETNLWSYHADYTGNDTLNQQAQDLVTNWLLFNWFDMIMEGTLTKLYKTVGDARDKTSFALYKQQQKDLIAGESQVIKFQGNLED